MFFLRSLGLIIAGAGLIFGAMAAPGAPVIWCPANGSGQPAPVGLGWYPGSDVSVKWALQISTDPNFGNGKLLVNLTGMANDNDYYTFTGAVNGITYYWRVNGTNGSGTSSWASRSFNVISSNLNLPSQFISKLYSEILGRAPDPAGWVSWHNYFITYGCNLATLTSCAQSFYASSEFANLHYTTPEIVFTMYRSLLCREPDQSGYTFYCSYLGASPSAALVNTTISSFMSNGAAAGPFAGGFSLDSVFNGRSYNGDPVGHLPILINPASFNAPSGEVPYRGNSCVDLQNVLNGLTPPAVVDICPRMVFMVTHMLTVPSGITLKTYSDGTTAGTITRNHYARLARFVRDPSNTEANQGVIHLNYGAKLVHVFVDGGANWGTLPPIYDQYGNPYRLGNNVEMGMGGTFVGTTMNECRLSDGQPSQLLSILPTISQSDENPDHNTYPRLPNDNQYNKFNTIVVTNNLLTNYERSYYAPPYPNLLYVDNWADGITCRTSKCTITGNHIIDPTDIGIVLFPTLDVTDAQNTTVSNNTIVNAGNSARAALSIDAWRGLVTQRNPALQPVSENFSGATFSNNTILMGTGHTIHYDFCINLNSRAWFGDSVKPIVGTAAPITVTGNYSNNTGIAIKSYCGILLMDISNVSLTNNTFNWVYKCTISPPASGPAFGHGISEGQATRKGQTPVTGLTSSNNTNLGIPVLVPDTCINGALSREIPLSGL